MGDLEKELACALAEQQILRSEASAAAAAATAAQIAWNAEKDRLLASASALQDRLTVSEQERTEISQQRMILENSTKLEIKALKEELSAASRGCKVSCAASILIFVQVKSILHNRNCISPCIRISVEFE